MRRQPGSVRRPLLLGAALAGLCCASPRAVARLDPSGRTLLRVRADGASRATLAGSMNGWRPEPLATLEGGFEIALDLSPGRYEYRIQVVDQQGAHVLFPEGAERVADGFGGENAVLRVR